ncbi:E3 ubiquitin-protein ligase TRIM39-like [Brachyhypopomus gauderio]|uniref:E3 ubiquitin-protein ligase TRIM39-like n=1 Tax=Brachyhypopomus gauderio TaxID=698409 RepID=UPI00404232CF
MASLEEELCCSICCGIFNDPVLLSCSHSFCKRCLSEVWGNRAKDCPLCRRRSSRDLPPLNLALKHVCEFLKKEKSRQNERAVCELHNESLKLFCKCDEEPVCVYCVGSTKHKGHEFCKLTEVIHEKRDDLAATLNPLKEKLEGLEKIKKGYSSTAAYIKKQASQTEAQIRQEFEQLHKFLRQEEEMRIAKLREEEREKNRMLEETVQNISRKLDSLSETITNIEKKITTEDISLLQSFNKIKTIVLDTIQDTEPLPVPLIDVAKHLHLLKYRVWEKMLDIIQYVPVWLDPLSAHPQLSVCEELTSVNYSIRGKSIPANPERFDLYLFVLGAGGFDSGSHCWEVEVGYKGNCRIGVARGSVRRKGHFSVCPKEGLYTIVIRKREIRAGTTPETHLNFGKQPQRIKVNLDYEKGEITFSDPSDGVVIYTFKDTFTEKLYPMFGLSKDSAPLRICPQVIKVAH